MKFYYKFLIINLNLILVLLELLTIHIHLLYRVSVRAKAIHGKAILPLTVPIMRMEVTCRAFKIYLGHVYFTPKSF